MPRLGLPIIAATVALLLAATSAAATPEQRVPIGAPETPKTIFSPDRVIVQWAGDASRGERSGARSAADVDFTRDLGSRRFQLVETEPGQSPREAVRELEANPAVVLAERDGYDALHAVPDDPLFGQLWGLLNSGSGIRGFAGAVAGADIDASGAWDVTIGSPSTVVADIDSGYRFEHPDLKDVVWANPGETLDGLDNDENGIVDDVHGADFVGLDAEAPAVDGNPTDGDLLSGGHGVHTAGTIGAEGNNGIGIAGVGQDIRLMPLRACSRFASVNESRCPFSAQVEAINYAGEMGARVANMSLGGTGNEGAVGSAIAANPQTLFVISAGNDGQDNDLVPHYPCNYDPPGEGKGAVDNVICVAATNQADGLAAFSDWGAGSVDLGAPGTETLSTYPVRRFIDENFEVDDFALKWVDSGANGGFARTNEPPLTSYGMSDSPGGPPVASSTRASTTAPVTVPAGFRNCILEQTRSLSLGGGSFRYEVRLDGSLLKSSTPDDSTGRYSLSLGDELLGGGEVDVRFRYTAGFSPTVSNGVWLDDIELRCAEPVGDASGYYFLQGTSMAAPHVSGAAALLFSLQPSATVTAVREALLGSVDPVPALAGKTVTGGRLNAAAAVDLFDAAPPPAPSLTATDPASPADENSPRLIGSAQAGTSIDVYANASCSGSPVASGTAAQLAAPGIAVSVADNTVTEFSATASDAVAQSSPCSAPIAYTEETDLAPPAPPLLETTDPASPGSSGTPRILGSAEAGSTVRIYPGVTCEGSSVASGDAAELGSPGLTVSVPEGVTATFSATATDVADNTSSCSAPISYTRESDLEPPAPPQLAATVPNSPGSSGAPRIVGAAEAGSTVRIFAGASCGALPIAAGGAAELASPGILVLVAEGITASFSATATDAADNTSACSAPISYTRLKIEADPGGSPFIPGTVTMPPPERGPEPPPPPPSCTVPKLAGKALAKAKTALARAGCKLGTVRKPKPRKGKRLPRLVVKSSTPVAGVETSGKVDLKLAPKPRQRKAHR
jgi:subtilisin family serine protease